MNKLLYNTEYKKRHETNEETVLFILNIMGMLNVLYINTNYIYVLIKIMCEIGTIIIQLVKMLIKY